MSGSQQYVSFSVAGQQLGIAVDKVQEILPPQPLTRVPRAQNAIAGLLNLRGQIVTAVDLKERLLLPKQAGAAAPMNMIVHDREELYSLLVDSVGDVLTLDSAELGPAPATLDECWKQCCEGVYSLAEELLVIVDVSALLDIANKT